MHSHQLHCDNQSHVILMLQSVAGLCRRFTLLANLVLASRQQLGFAAPELNLPGDCSPRHVLGKVRNNVVYEATSRHAGEKFRFAVKVRPVPVGMPRIDTFGCLAVCTERMHSAYVHDK